MNALFMLKSILNIVRVKHFRNKQIKVGGIPFIHCVFNINLFYLCLIYLASNISKCLPSKSYSCFICQEEYFNKMLVFKFLWVRHFLLNLPQTAPSLHTFGPHTSLAPKNIHCDKCSCFGIRGRETEAQII